MGAEKRRKVLLDFVEEEEEDAGLACPPFDEEDVMAAQASYDLSEVVFFSGIEVDYKTKQKKHGKGKEMKVLEEVNRHKDNANWKDTPIETSKDEYIESKKTLTKAAVVDVGVSFQQKINLAKRKLHERYEQIAREKKRRQIQVLNASELPQEKCRAGKYRSGFAPKFRSFAGCR